MSGRPSHLILERLFVMTAWLSALSILVVIGIFTGYLLQRGFGTLGPDLFFGTVPIMDALTGKVPVWHGIWPTMVGTLFLVMLSTAMAIPMGLTSGIYLAEYAEGRWKSSLSFAVDLLAGTPSIIMGLFGFALILFLRKTFLPGANVCVVFHIKLTDFF